jgi:hypothetical protein
MGGGKQAMFNMYGEQYEYEGRNENRYADDFEYKPVIKAISPHAAKTMGELVTPRAVFDCVYPLTALRLAGFRLISKRKELNPNANRSKHLVATRNAAKLRSINGEA